MAVPWTMLCDTQVHAEGESYIVAAIPPQYCLLRQLGTRAAPNNDFHYSTE